MTREPTRAVEAGASGEHRSFELTVEAEGRLPAGLDADEFSEALFAALEDIEGVTLEFACSTVETGVGE